MARSGRREGYSWACDTGHHDRCVDGAAIHCTCPCHAGRTSPPPEEAEDNDWT